MVFQLAMLLLVLILLILAVSKWKWHPFIALLVAALSLGLLLGMGGKQTVDAVLTGFGNTMKWIAIVVILGAFIGEVLRDTGGALRISNAVVKKTGPDRLPWAMGITGYLVSIPVFVDVAYIVLQPVTEALALRSKKPVLVIGLALTAGLTVSHTLIPPTPGPLFVASQLDLNLGNMLLVNGITGIFAMIGGIIWASHFCKNSWLPYDAQLKERGIADYKNEETTTQKSVVIDLLPILIPILLMGTGAFIAEEDQSGLGQIIHFISTPMIAVFIGAAIALLQLRGNQSRDKLNDLVERSIIKSALVIMITGAGGAFGFVIKQSGLQGALGTFFMDLPFLGFLLPFLAAAVLTTATGSITVSLIGTVSIVGPMAESMPYEPEIMAALIGAGSFCVFHANSSFFWLLNRLHDVPMSTLYRTFTLQSLVMGLSGLIGVIILWGLGLG